MYIMFADEADYVQGNNDIFFVYGSVFINVNQLSGLQAVIARIRRDAGFKDTESFKFKTKSRPENITREVHTAAKQKLLKAAHEKGVVFASYAILHALGHNQHRDDLVKFGANTILARFNQFLRERRTYGIAFFDRMPIAQEHAYFRQKFQLGLEFPHKPNQPLDRILSYSSTCDGASHFSSLADIIVGSFRYCVNEPDGVAAATQIWPEVAKLFWGRDDSNTKTKYVRNLGLTLSPADVQHPDHKAKYDSLIERLKSYTITT